MNISVNWVDGMLMVGKSDSGHSITMDGPPELVVKILVLGQWKCFYLEWLAAQ